MAEQFNMYTTEKKKVVREMVVLLHQQYIIFAVDLMGGKEYDYWEHIEVSIILLYECTIVSLYIYYDSACTCM